MEWKDTTSYSRGDKERTPTCFTARAGDLQITVLSSHIYYPGRWVMHCAPFYNTYELKVDTLEAAQAKALALVRAKVQAIVSALAD